ncbi:hypothetical protein ATANTOWER_031639 [Ataeniobius toweri]|uniref:Uncharacterized protein n=1 Tax=Ataeniobius toweri TaxID=208326 RepID=A0ABU7BVK4_9TELE|nr:hypothetical protein [Ataeniobius toweri]
MLSPSAAAPAGQQSIRSRTSCSMLPWLQSSTEHLNRLSILCPAPLCSVDTPSIIAHSPCPPQPHTRPVSSGSAGCQTHC